MGSILPNNFGRQPDGESFPVKTEYNHIEDQQQFHSSEDEFGGPNERQSQPRESLSCGDGYSSQAGSDGFSFAAVGGGTATPNTSAPVKDGQPISKRTLQNRKAQREFRQRRATYLKDLEAKVRRYESDPAGVHPEVHHRINHLVQEIQYLRAIIDRLQLENAELRRSDSAYGTPQGISSGSQPSYTLHPAYPPPASIHRSPQSYDSNSSALAEIYQPPYQQAYSTARNHTEGESRPVGYSSDQSGSHTISHQVVDGTRGSALYASNPPIEWSAVRQSAVDDRPRTAPLDLTAATPVPQHDRDRSESAHAYLYPSSGVQAGYYQDSGRHSQVLPDDAIPNSSHAAHHHTLHTSNTNPGDPTAGSGGGQFTQYGQAYTGGSQTQRPSGIGGQGQHHTENGAGWHSSATTGLVYGPAGVTGHQHNLAGAEGGPDRNYRQATHSHHQAISHYPRSNSHSPVQAA